MAPYRVECYDCKDLIEKKNSPDVCKSEEAMNHFQPKSKILYCTDVNLNHDCRFAKLKLWGLVGKFFSD